jgi:hypothetical protein
MSTAAETLTVPETPTAQPEGAPSAADHPFNSSAIVIDLDPKSIRVPKARQKSFSMEDEKDKMFVGSVRRAGILQPPEVRKVGDHYELVFGRRRLWAARQLGLATISVRVSTWNDDQVGWVATAENTHRGQLKPTQWLKQIQVLMQEFERCFGPDPGRSVGGQVRAHKASRDPQTRKFRGECKAEPTEDTSGLEPATRTVRVAGSEAEPDPGGEPTSRRRVLTEATGRNAGTIDRDIRLAKAFTEEQLTVLDAFAVTTEDLMRLAAIPDPLARSTAVNLIAGGCSVDQTLENLSAMQANGGDQQRREEVRTAELSDDVWLAGKCTDLRKLLQDTRSFDRDALLWRHVNSERNTMKARCKGLVVDSLKAGWTPFALFLKNLFWVEHPNDWYVCGECQGQNQDQPQCEKCNGTGYRVKVGTPKK